MSTKNKKEKKISIKPLSGFMELLPSQQMVFNEIFEIIRRSYESFGFIPLDTPVLERAEVLLAKAGGETEKQIYRFTKGKTDLAMRFDMTVPLARYVANNYGELTFPFKRYAMGKVYRGERPQAGRFREFYQCDIDIIGDGNLELSFDAEIPTIIYAVFRKLGFEKFTIRINNRKIFNGLFDGLGVSEYSTCIMQSIDRLEKIGTEAVRNELNGYGLSIDVVDKLFDFIKLRGDNDQIILGLKKLGVKSTIFSEGIDELAEVIALMRGSNVPEENFKVDLTIARGLDYYTGTVYETQLNEYPEIGSVCSGGRYDDLAGHYTKRSLPGVGISIGLTRLFDQLTKKGVLKSGKATPTEVLIIPMTKDKTSSLGLATKLRDNGIAAEVSFVEGKIKKRISYADKLGIPFVVFIGEEEIRGGFLTVKNLKDGTQKQCGENYLIEKLKK